MFKTVILLCLGLLVPIEQLYLQLFILSRDACARNYTGL